MLTLALFLQVRRHQKHSQITADQELTVIADCHLKSPAPARAHSLGTAIVRYQRLPHAVNYYTVRIQSNERQSCQAD